MKKRVFSPKFKAEAVRRMQAGESPSALAKTLKVLRKSLYQWRDTVLADRPLRGVGRPKKHPGAKKAGPDLARQVQELEQLVGQLTVENRFFEGALQQIKELRQGNSELGETESSPRSKR